MAAEFRDIEGRRALAERLVYTGSAHHKRSPGDYGFQPPASPRPTKSLCDGNRAIPRDEAKNLFRTGILMGMFSEFEGDGLPKYVWNVDDNVGVYEAKIGRDDYHGYQLGDEDNMRLVILKEWSARCQAG